MGDRLLPFEEDRAKETAKRAILDAFNEVWEYGEAELTFKVGSDPGFNQWKLEKRFIRRGKK